MPRSMSAKSIISTRRMLQPDSHLMPPARRGPQYGGTPLPCQTGSSRSSPRSSTKRRKAATGCTKLNSMATGCMRASTLAPRGYSPSPGSTGRINIRRSPQRSDRSAPARAISTANCAAWARRHHLFRQIRLASDSGNAAALVFFLFDLLHLDVEDPSGLPTIERKERLAELLANSGSPLHHCDHQIGHGREFHEKA